MNGKSIHIYEVWFLVSRWKSVLTTFSCIQWHGQSWTLGGWQSPLPFHPATSRGRVNSKCHIMSLNAVNWNHHIHLLIHVPVQASVFQNKPVLLPFLRKIGFSILLFPQPALAVPLTQIPAGNPSFADWRHGTCSCRYQQGSRTDEWVRKHFLWNTCLCLGVSTCDCSSSNLLPLLFFFDLDSSEDRSNTWEVKQSRMTTCRELQCCSYFNKKEKKTFHKGLTW